MLPRLVAQGFKGRIFCTPGTQDLCSLVLPDAGRLQEEEADRANRGGYSRHKPARPLFTEAQAVVTLSRLQPVGYERPIPVAQRTRGGVHPHRPPARRRLRPDAACRRQRRHGALRRRPRPLQPPHPAGPVGGFARRCPAGGIHLRRSRAPERTTSWSAWPPSSTRRRRNTASSSFRRLPSAGSRKSSTRSRSSRTPGRSRRWPSTWTVRWRSRP